MAALADAERVQEQVRARLGRRPGVRGVGVTRDDDGNARVRINVDPSVYDEVRRLIEPDIEGVAVELRRVGPLRAFSG